MPSIKLAGRKHRLGYDAVMRPQVGCWETQGPPTFGAVYDLPFHTIRPSEHSACEIHFTLGKQVTDPAGAYPLAPQGDFRHFVGENPNRLLALLRKLDISLAIMAKRKTAPEINLTGVKSFADDIPEELFGADHRKVFIEFDNNRLFNSKNTEMLRFLDQGL